MARYSTAAIKGRNTMWKVSSNEDDKLRHKHQSEFYAFPTNNSGNNFQYNPFDIEAVITFDYLRAKEFAKGKTSITVDDIHIIGGPSEIHEDVGLHKEFREIILWLWEKQITKDDFDDLVFLAKEFVNRVDESWKFRRRKRY